VYKSERIGLVDALVSAHTFRDFITVVGIFTSVSNSDAAAVLHVRSLRADAVKVRTTLEEQKVAQLQLAAQLAVQEKQVERTLAAASQQFVAVQAEMAKRKSGWAFPVKGAYSYIDTFGAPRMEGTKYYHRHEGNDIFALKGTPLVAVVDGVIENVGTAVLGGNKVWLRSPGDNWTYYYAHLSAYAAGIANGVRVHKGDVIGYVGNTGNAQGTPPHVHFETHVPSGAAIDPYTILRRADPLVK
ncbi:MAG: M23 family metallopeptidase, partial [Actinobacteria bacterium]|nr:M23 family metallopeptidase [Actinomycetota bacterium]